MYSALFLFAPHAHLYTRTHCSIHGYSLVQKPLQLFERNVALSGLVSQYLHGVVPGQLLRARQKLKLPHQQREQLLELDVHHPPPKAPALAEAKRDARVRRGVELLRPGLWVRDQPPPGIKRAHAVLIAHAVVARAVLAPSRRSGFLGGLAAQVLRDGQVRGRVPRSLVDEDDGGALGDGVPEDDGVGGALPVRHGGGVGEAQDLLDGGEEQRNLERGDLLVRGEAACGDGVRVRGAEARAQGRLLRWVVGEELDAPGEDVGRGFVAAGDEAEHLRFRVS